MQVKKLTLSTAALLAILSTQQLLAREAVAAPVVLTTPTPSLVLGGNQKNPVITGFTFQVAEVLVGPDISSELIPSIQSTATVLYNAYTCVSGSGRGGGYHSSCGTMSFSNSTAQTAVPFTNGNPLSATFNFGLLAQQPHSMNLSLNFTAPNTSGPFTLQLFDTTTGTTITSYKPGGYSFANLAGGDQFQLLLTAPTFNAPALTITASLAAPVAAVPEPGTWAMMIAGLGILGSAARHRKA